MGGRNGASIDLRQHPVAAEVRAATVLPGGRWPWPRHSRRHGALPRGL